MAETLGSARTPGVTRDPHDLRSAENALMQREACLRAYFAAASVGIVRLWLDGTIAECNPAFAAMLGVSQGELMGRKPETLLFAADRGAAARLLAEADAAPLSSRAIELRYVHRDGSTVWGHVSLSCARDENGDALFYTYVVQDITERKRLEVTLRHAQRLESVGRLAAGVAHEINTPIQFVGDNVQFLETSFDALLTLHRRRSEVLAACDLPEAVRAELRALDDEADVGFMAAEIPKALAETMQGVAAVARIVKAMKRFAHPDRGEEQASVDLNDAIECTLAIAGSQVKHVADVRTCLGELPPVRCHPGDVNQVLLNLFVNAADAIAERAGSSGARGCITVTSRSDAAFVTISVEDTGAGIPEGIRGKVFEPFFTTKEVGRGTGQGLALARSIVVDKHKGELAFESTLGRGTTFHVRLPIKGRSRGESGR
jgi:PAS domain S-box-containing protein